MLGRVKAFALRTANSAVAASLRLLSISQRTEILQTLLPSMVADIPIGSSHLRFYVPTPLLYDRARSALLKEPDTIEWINGFRQDDVFWDIGANVGVYSLYAAGIGKIRTLSFEPSADNYAALCRNALLNDLGDTLLPYCIAFAGKTQTGVLNVSSSDIGSAMHQFGRPGEGSRYWKGAVTHGQGLLGFSVDDFVRQFAPPFPNHVKLDVDGLELPILEGAAGLLRDSRLRSIMVELNLNDEKELTGCKALLASAGFECVRLGKSFQVGEEKAMNHFFERRP